MLVYRSVIQTATSWGLGPSEISHSLRGFMETSLGPWDFPDQTGDQVTPDVPINVDETPEKLGNFYSSHNFMTGIFI